VQNCPESMVPEPLKGHLAAARIYPISRNITTADSHAGTFTAACGLLIYRGTGLPEEYQGNALACDPTGNLIHRDRLVSKGPTFAARRAREGVELVASTDDWFRPVFLANAPDGALYVCDMYRKTIEHPQYLPEEIRKRTDFESGKGLGRIYRVVAAASPSPARNRRIQLDTAATRQLCEHLNHSNGWWRDTAHRLLLERKDTAAVPRLKALAARASLPQTRLQALYVLAALEALADESIRRAITDPAAGVREGAMLLAETRLATNGASWLAPLLARAEDPDARVRFQCALTLGEVDDRRILPALAQVAWRDSSERWTRAAVLSALGRRPEEFLREIIRVLRGGNPGRGQDGLPGGGEALPEFMNELARTLATGSSTDRLPAVLGKLIESEREDAAGWQMAALAGFAEGVRGRGLATAGDSSLGAWLGEEPGAAAARQRIAWLTESARGLAGDAGQPLPARVAAIGLLGQAQFGAAGETLLGLLDPRESAALNNAAIRSLAQMSDPGIVPALLAVERWRSYSPGVREAILASLLSQPRHLPAVFALLEAGTISSSAIDSGRRKQLMEHKDERIRERANTLFKSLATGDRMKVYEDYKPVLNLAAKPVNGQAVFKQACAACHRLDREGVPVGPDLFSIRNQPKEAILLHILIPEYEIVPGYASYTIETRDGRTLSGLIASETDTSITLRRALGEEETILRHNIASISATNLSLMPQELEKNMSRQDLADLIAYLKGE
jgi:putative heme-binding domain-containing protein